ncbi:SMP-30/gluconolactonase/LRE family protein [Streptomyces cavernae]|uniref:SMP-30/gluconolactonase/LRE family protein n=1 Tax=Streptomyces cavernae TaxID=2259034 RepID=UPI000FEB942A|nr:SMP-30/gluconolactonase/LRE family protein [Streptomyces cavernae]
MDRTPPLRLIPVGGRGPEDVVTDASGRVFTGLADGRILRLEGVTDPAGPRIETVADTRGRPLGLQPLPDGALLVCDAERGLLRCETDGTVRVLADTVAGARLRFCSNVVTADDTTVYFTVSSRRYGLEHWQGDLLEHTGTGMLLRLRPGGEPEVLLDGLQFANGVALAADQSFLVVAETGARRLVRHGLTGDAEPRGTFADDLPGYPDNLWRDPDGLIWVALAGPRVPVLDVLHRRGPALRRAAGRAATRLPFRPVRDAWVMAFDDDGRIVHDVRHRRAPYRMSTSVCPVDGQLVLGSVWEPSLAVFASPAAR